jgi:uncharacterized alkaline shock family protein YloU
VTDFSTDNRPAPNGPSPFPPRPDEPRPMGSTDPGSRLPGSVGRPLADVGAQAGGGAHRPATDPGPAPGPAPGVHRLPPEIKGRIQIADEVVEKVAGLAAVEVEGVADVGGDFARAIESVRERIGIGNKRGDQGIKAEVSGHEVAISVTIMVEFGHVVMEVARQVQANVAVQTNRMLGLKVVEVNVTVDDVRTSPAPDPADDDHGSHGEG